MITVLLVDDHELVRMGIKRILEDEKGIKVIAQAKTGEEAVSFCRKEQPNIVLMDMDMPGIGGLEATKKILRYAPDTKVIVLTVHTENPIPTKVMQIGASGYLTKGTAPKEMIHCIRAVHSGQRYLPPEVAQQIALSQFTSVDENPLNLLSERELQIMIMVTRGEKVPDISEHLMLSTKTINSYRYRIFDKLSVSNDVELTHLAIRHGVLNTEKL